MAGTAENLEAARISNEQEDSSEQLPRLLGRGAPANEAAAGKDVLNQNASPEGGWKDIADAPFVHPDRVVKRQNTLKAGPKGCESINFDLHESRQYVEYILRRSHWQGRLKGGFRWLYLCLVGIGTGLVAVAIQASLHEAWHYKLHLQEWMEEHGHGILPRYLTWTGIHIALASIAGAFVCFVEPLSAGSGIPEIKCYLNGINIPGVLRARTLICKACGIVCSVAAGLPCGKEGPMIHSGAIVAAQMARRDAGPLVGPYRANREARDIVAAGAAAGVAAAFGAPIGGVLFAVEEGATHMNPVILTRCFVCASFAAFTVRFFLGPLHAHSPFGVLGVHVPVEFGRFTGQEYTVLELFVFALMGCVGGLLGAAFNGANRKLSLWRKAHVGPTGVRRWIEVLFVTASISSINFFAPMIGHGSHMGHYGPSQRLFVQSGNASINHLFHSREDFPIGMLVFFIVVHYLEACWTYGLGVPSGLFVPSLLAGATWGRLLGQVLAPLVHVRAHAGLFSLIGATAALSGMARITVSLAMILMETTGEAACALPVFITSVFAKWTGDLFNEGLYDIHIHLKKVPLLEGHTHKHLLMLRAADVMTKTVVTVSPRVAVADLLALLGCCEHQGFPVLEADSQKFAGMVERRTLLQLLSLGKEHGAFEDPDRADGEGQEAPLVPYEAMLQNRVATLEEVQRALTMEDGQMMVNLVPYMNPGCHTVKEETLLARTYHLFRGMGLRHLPVVAEDRTIKGIITRKDLIFEEEENGHGRAQVAARADAAMEATAAAAAAREQVEREGQEPAGSDRYFEV